MIDDAVLDVLVCPHCKTDKGSKLAFVQDSISPELHCENCDRRYPIINEIIDFCPGLKGRSDTGLAQKFMEYKTVVSVYEDYFRPAFTRLGSSIKYDEEIQWLTDINVEIPVKNIVDLACGTGKYSRLMNRLYHPEFVFAVDISFPMLEKAVANAREANMDNMVHIRADASALPFKKHSLQRANCFGALHLFPDVPEAIREIARVSSAGAVFSCLTSRETGHIITGLTQLIFSKLFSFHFFKEDWLEKELNLAGFGDMEKQHKNMVLLLCCRKAETTG